MMSRTSVILVVAAAQALHGCDRSGDLLRMLGRDRLPGIVRGVAQLVRLRMDTLEILVERVTGDAAFLQSARSMHDFRRIDPMGRDRDQT